MTQLSYSEIIKKYPSPEKLDLRNDIALLLKELNIKIVILDDDPTGIQTVHGCLLLTSWSNDNLKLAFDDTIPFFYILTNTRSLVPGDAQKITEEVVQTVISINREYLFRLIFISRSDSTLRGHFPLEQDTICKTMFKKNITLSLPVFFAPALLEAGRYTIDDVHYLRERDALIPVAETEFARDQVFGYHSSDLKNYMIEKSKNKISEKQVGSIAITDLRENSIDGIMEIIRGFKNKKYVVINAFDYNDLRKFALAFLKLLSGSDTSAVLRTSSSLPKALAAIEDKSLLSGKDIIKKDGPGFFIVGSHVKKTTLQLHALLKHPKIRGIEIDVCKIQTTPEKVLQNILRLIHEAYSRDITPVIYTSRKEFRSGGRKESILRGKKISAFLVNLVKNLPFSPAYIITKGGITSHDVIADGLKIKCARVMGQLIEGVPVIMTGESSIFPDMPCIIFPGNVGENNSLSEVYKKLSFKS